MLIGHSSKRPNLEEVRRIKQTLREVLQLPEEAILTVSELACMEEECAPFETVIGLLRSNAPQLQYKIHKSVKDIDAQDLIFLCSEWGFDVHISILKPIFNSNYISRR